VYNLLIMDKNTIKQAKKRTIKRTLTRKEAGFVRDVIVTKNPAEAVRRNYNLGSKGGKHKNNTAYAIAFENLRKPKIAALLYDSGLTPEYLTNQLKNTIDDSENDSAKLKGIELGFKLHGELKNGTESTGTKINVYQQYNGMTNEELNEKIAGIQKKIQAIQGV